MIFIQDTIYLPLSRTTGMWGQNEILSSKLSLSSAVSWSLVGCKPSNGAMLLDHSSSNNESKTPGRERSRTLRFFTNSKSTGQMFCNNCSKTGSCLTSVVFMFSKRSLASCVAGTRAQTGDGLAKDRSNGLREIGARCLSCSVCCVMHQFTTVLTGLQYFSREANNVFTPSKGLWGLQYLKIPKDFTKIMIITHHVATLHNIYYPVSVNPSILTRKREEDVVIQTQLLWLRHATLGSVCCR